MAGTSGIYDSIPRFLAKSATGLGPTLSINCALMVFFEFANAFLRVLNPPYLSLELVGHHGSGFPNLFGSIQKIASGRESQGESFN